jgi:hypothetical protein
MQMDNEIKVTIKSLYGQDKIYPANAQAERLASLVGTKTLTNQTLRQAVAMGFSLSYVDRFGTASGVNPDYFNGLTRRSCR